MKGVKVSISFRTVWKTEYKVFRDLKMKLLILFVVTDFVGDQLCHKLISLLFHTSGFDSTSAIWLITEYIKNVAIERWTINLP